MELNAQLKRKIAAYHPAPAALDVIRRTPILFLVGVSGAGKDTVIPRLMQLHPGEYRIIISHTTRLPRENNGVMERNDVEYHFIDFATVDRMLDEQAFIEAKLYADNIYGSSIAEIKAAQDEGKIALGAVTVDGIDEYAGLNLNSKNVFLLPPSYEEWQRRLLSRYEGNVDQHDLYKRMKTALAEIEHALSTEYFYIVINDSLDKTVELVSRIAHGEEIEPHYPKVVAIAEDIVSKTRKRLAELE